MPSEAVGLDLYITGVDSTGIDEIHDIVSSIGFKPNPHGAEMVGDIVNFQPFENTEENRELVEDCVTRLSDEFEELEVSYEIRENRDRGEILAKRCTIRVESDQ